MKLQRLEGPLRRGVALGAALCLGATAVLLPAIAGAASLRIGVIAPFAAIPGKSIVNGAELAAADINASGDVAGRKIKLFEYDDHFSATDAVRAYQRAVLKDHVSAVVGVFTSEVALALMPWAARLHVPTLMSGPSTTAITQAVHAHYARNRYTFQTWLNTNFMAQSVCDFAREVLVPHGAKTAVVVSEDAAWTKPLDQAYAKCLPKAGLQVLAVTRFSRETNDFTPVFDKVQALHPDVVMTGWAHVGVKPMIQWHALHIPAVLVGLNAQAEVSAFWKATNGAADGAIAMVAAVDGERLTPKTIGFIHAYIKRFGVTPAYDSYSTYAAVYILKQAVERAHSTSANALVKAIEKTDYVGPYGRIEFYGRDSRYTHGAKYGKHYITTSMMQWQHGKQYAVWPSFAAMAQPVLSSLHASRVH